MKEAAKNFKDWAWNTLRDRCGQEVLNKMDNLQSILTSPTTDRWSQLTSCKNRWTIWRRKMTVRTKLLIKRRVQHPNPKVLRARSRPRNKKTLTSRRGCKKSRLTIVPTQRPNIVHAACALFVITISSKVRLYSHAVTLIEPTTPRACATIVMTAKENKSSKMFDWQRPSEKLAPRFYDSNPKLIKRPRFKIERIYMPIKSQVNWR